MVTNLHRRNEKASLSDSKPRQGDIDNVCSNMKAIHLSIYSRSLRFTAEQFSEFSASLLKERIRLGCLDTLL